MIVGQDLHISDIAGADIMTVKNQMGFFVDNVNSTAAIDGNNPNGSLNINENTSINDGPVISLNGMSGSAIAAGQLHYYSFGQNGRHEFANANSLGIVHTNASISALGQTILGYDTHVSDIVNGDVLTVKNQMGFMYGGLTATMNGNAPTGTLNIQENNSATNGPSFSMNGTMSLLNPGQIFYNSHGIGGVHNFQNYDGTAFHTNAAISASGQMIVGQDRTVSDIINGDVLTVQDKIGFYAGIGGNNNIIDGNAPAGSLSIQENNSADNGPSIGLLGKDYPTLPTGENRAGQIRFNSYLTSGYGHLFLNYNSTAAPDVWSCSMAIQANGKVVIGQDLIWSPSMATATPDGYNLYVSKGILTEKLKVANSADGANWSDFVFNKDYKLMPLSKLESYVKANKHLPEIPTAAEVAKDGIDVAAMDAKLLQKIEELTLYVIEQQKQIDELKRQVKH